MRRDFHFHRGIGSGLSTPSDKSELMTDGGSTPITIARIGPLNLTTSEAEVLLSTVTDAIQDGYSDGQADERQEILSAIEDKIRAVADVRHPALAPDGGATADAPQRTAPETIPCPCGDGQAERRKRVIDEPLHEDAERRQVTFTYRHQGCPIGGHIVVADGQVVRRTGPLFDGGLPKTAVTDGGQDHMDGVYL